MLRNFFSSKEELLHTAARNGKVEKVRELLDRGGVDIEHEDGVQSTPLSWAAVNGHLEIITMLLQAGAEKNTTNKYGNTPLMLASWNRHVDVCRLLIDAGADTEATNAEGAAMWPLALIESSESTADL